MSENETPEDRFREFVKGKQTPYPLIQQILSSPDIPEKKLGLYYHYKDINFDGTWKDHVGKN
ncbi:MAG: hypothetical protein GY834_11380 [Bacteroidetes bacterium]|nr:hypothetical protein [Bacteroidota bacterium]